jgi:hypothetical protein
MPSTTHESRNLEKLLGIEGNSGFEKGSLPDVLHDTQNERMVLKLSESFNSLSKLDIPNYGKVEYYFPSVRLILDNSSITKEKSKWLTTMGFEVINLKPKPNEKLSKLSIRILEILTQRNNRIELRRTQIQHILLEKFHIADQTNLNTKVLINSADFILNYLEAQNIKGRNDFSILELAAGDLGVRGYDQKGELYVPLVCEVLTRSGFAVDGIDKYQAISSQNLDFGQVQNVDLTSDTWEENIKHRYNMVVFLRNWQSEVFLHRYREESKVVIFENDFLVEDFVSNLLLKIYDILEDDGVLFTTHPFKKKDLFDVDTIFARFHLEVFYNLDGLILARKKGVELL